MPEPFAVAVAVRSGGEAGLQGVRCALSLSLGDRVPRLYLLDGGRELLRAPAGSEVEAVLRSLVDEVGVEVVVEGDPGAVPAGVSRRRRERVLEELAGSPFQQVF